MSAESESKDGDLRPAGRRARKKERTRREIYDASMTLFDRDGFDRVTIEQICEAADVARGTFFLHFPTKSALLLEFGRALEAELVPAFGEPGESAVQDIEQLVDMIGLRLLEHGDVVFALFRAFMSAPPPQTVPIANEIPLRPMVEGIIRRGQTQGTFDRELHPRLGATLFLGTAVAILGGAVFQPGEVTPAELRAQFLRAVMSGLGAR